LRPLYDARLEDLGPGDLVQVECACGHIMLLLRGRGNIFGEAFGRIFAGVLAPFLIEPHTGSPIAFFGTIVIIVSFGAFIPLLFGKETVGQLEAVTELVPEYA
jgi:hypothetical protein